MRYCLIAFVTSVGLLAACVTLPSPDDEEAYRDAVGSVTVSTPLFTPLEAAARDDRALDFGEFRSEENLIESIHRPQLGITEFETQALEILASANFAGARTATTETTTRSVENRLAELDYQRESKRTFQSPDQRELPSAPSMDEALQEKLLTVFDRAQMTNRLAPDEIATLVAAYKTYMVNLEEYFNIEGFDYSNGIHSDFVPYKVHFTVTAEPGWYTRWNRFDAVAELAFGDDAGDDFRVLAVTPAETAQTIDRLAASFEELRLALSVGALLNPVAVQGLVTDIEQSAQRLQGLYSTKTVVVGFPRSNSLRIRFMPRYIPSRQVTDLQPITRMLTAIVLVRKSSCLSSSKEPTFQLSVRPEQMIQIRDDQNDTRQQSANGTVDQDMMQAGAAGQASQEKKPSAPLDRELHLAALFANDAHLDAEMSRVAHELKQLRGKPLESRTCTIIVDWYFTQNATDTKDGNWAVHDLFGLFPSKGGKGRLPAENTYHTQHQTQIPPWLGEARKPFRVGVTFGHYQVFLKDLEAAELVLAKEKERLDAARERLEKALGVASEEAPPSGGGASAQVTSAAQSQGDPGRSGANSDRPEPRDDEEIRQARAALQQAQEQYDRRLADLHREIRNAGQAGRVTVGYRIRAPKHYVTEQGKLAYARAWVRVKGLSFQSNPEDDQRSAEEASQPFTPLGIGDQEGVLEVENVDLSSAVSFSNGKVHLSNLQAFLEAVLVDELDHPDWPPLGLRRTAVLETVLKPQAITGSAGSSGSPRSPNKGSSIELDVDSVRLELMPHRENKPSTAPPTEPGPKNEGTAEVKKDES